MYSTRHSGRITSFCAVFLTLITISGFHSSVEAFGYKKLLKYGALAGAFAGPYGGLGGLGGFGGFRFGDFGGGYAAPYAYGGYGYPGYGFGYYG